VESPASEPSNLLKTLAIPLRKKDLEKERNIRRKKLLSLLCFKTFDHEAIAARAPVAAHRCAWRYVTR
jgi:hypothetical protein